MSPQERYLPLPGSEKAPVAGARRLGPAPPDELVGITVLVRGAAPAAAAAAVRRLGDQPVGGRRRLTREEYAALHGAAAADIELVAAFAGRHGLEVSAISSAQRTVRLAGTVAQLGAAFRVQLSCTATETGAVFRGRTGEVCVPAALADVVKGVFGLDDRPQANPYFRYPAASIAPSSSSGFLPTEVAELYRFPRGVDGSGQTVAIIELGGGFRRRDLNRYFAEIGVVAPEVVAVSVDGSRNEPTGDENGPDAEVMLDIEVVGAVAPGARVAVYFAPNTSQGFLNAVLAAVHDTERAPAVVSISWGAPESDWTRQSLRAMDEAFQAGALLGVTICVAAGDSGSSDGLDDGDAHVDFPASSPHALACGGTRLEGAAGRIRRETVWGGARAAGATGGGVSDAFPLPDWQSAAGVPPSPNHGRHRGRGVPDVAGNADPATGYRIRVDGKTAVIGGTSAVSPLLAGLVALVNECAGRPVGFLNPLIYGTPGQGAFRDIGAGTNGLFAAAPGWDACTGLGSPVGEALAALVAPPPA